MYFFSWVSSVFLLKGDIFVSVLPVSFELMRKEQHKSFQEKQKLGLDKSGSGFDISTLMDGSKNEKKLLNRSSMSNDSAIPSASDNDSENSSVPPQTLASRPLVPPGFTSTVLDRNVGAKSGNHPDSTEVTTVCYQLLCISGGIVCFL